MMTPVRVTESLADSLTRGVFTLSGDSRAEPVEIGDALATGTGDQNGRYRVIRALGRGGGGWVYDVADALHPNRAVALKIADGRAADQASLSLFKVEFSTMTKLDHPNVARVYDFEEIRRRRRLSHHHGAG